jgi:hypothetical protein
MFKPTMLGAAALLAATAVLPRPAHAIPVAQGRCETFPVTIHTGFGFAPMLALPLSINNGANARNAVVRVSADIGVDPGAEVRIGYSVDGGAPIEGVFGPANLANHQEFFETRATMAIVRLPAGVHAVAPFWRVNGPPGKNATMTARCATIEGFTK